MREWQHAISGMKIKSFPFWNDMTIISTFNSALGGYAVCSTSSIQYKPSVREVYSDIRNAGI